MRNPIVVGQRVYLRAEEPDDVDAMALQYAQETDDFTDDWGRYPMSPITFQQMMEKSAQQYPPTSLTLQSCLIDDDSLIGWVGIFDLDLVDGTGETFSHFAPGEWRGRGYGTESKFLLLEYCFDHLGLHVIQSYVFAANERSAAALRKQGYQPAGTLRWHGTRRGVYLDTLMFDVKRDEYLAARERWENEFAQRSSR